MSIDDVVSVGSPVPDITLPSLSGNPVRLADYVGKKLLVFIWGSW